MRKTILLAGILSMASVAAQAADNGIYVGASLGRASVQDKEQFIAANGESVRYKFDGDDMGFKLLAGVRPLDWFGIEGSYVNFGDQKETVRFTLQNQPREVDIDVQGYGLSGFLVGYIPIGPVDVFGKAGLVSWDIKTKDDFQQLDWERNDDEDLAYGVGVQFRLLSLGLRAEYEVFDIDGIDDINLLSLGVTYTFL